MRRRRFLAVAGTGLIAGCSGDSNGGTSTQTATDTSTPAPTPTATPTPDPTPTESSAPDVDIVFRTCTTVQVTTGAYEAVGLTLANGESVTYEEGYSGTEDFTAESPIREAVVWTEHYKTSSQNPSLEECTSTPTPDPYDPQTARENAQEPSYEELFRNFESYKGEPIRFQWGQIYQSIYEDSYDYFQINVDQNRSGSWQGDIAAMWYGDKRYLEDDVFNPLVGVAQELHTYETVQGDSRTIPLLELVYVELGEL